MKNLLADVIAYALLTVMGLGVLLLIALFYYIDHVRFCH